MASPKNPALRAQYATKGALAEAAAHRAMSKVALGIGFVLMLCSMVALHWAFKLAVDLPTPLDWIAALAWEATMALSAKYAADMMTRPRGQGRSQAFVPWMVFLFTVAVAIAANLGHAFSVVEANLAATTLPAFLGDSVIYGFVAAIACLIPLGGSAMVHLSGHIAKHGTGAGWVDDNTELVYEVAEDAQVVGARAPQRAQRPPTERATAAPARAEQSAQRAQTPAEVPARSPRNADEQERVRELYDRDRARDPFTKPDAAAIQRELDLGHLNAATPRRWINKWWSEDEGTVSPASDPIAEQVAADEAAAEKDDDTNENVA